MDEILIVNPKNNEILENVEGKYLIDSTGMKYPIIKNVPRITEMDNYTDNFGLQWNKFSTTQIDNESSGFKQSKERFFAETLWEKEDLAGKNILEVGSGAGRFSHVVLQYTNGNLYSLDYSDAVTANYINNGKIAPERFFLCQASIYEMPFLDNSFDKVFCFGVLQHTPNFEQSVKALIDKCKIGGEIVVDFYPIKGWWTKIQAKYLLRPITKKMSHETLLNLIDRNADFLIKLHFFLHKIGLGIFTRFLPLVDIKGTIPTNVDKKLFRELVVLDTFDMFSPEYDNPQKIKTVVKMFEKYGAKVTFSDFITYGEGNKAAVVRGIKCS